jgi:hypothetical protein
MNDLRPTIIPKSDQLNADDLIGRTLTIKVSKVSISGEAEQPVSIHFEGDGGKPYKICKSMRRVLVHVWGADGNAYVGRRMTLYRDDKVRFGGLEVGGIRISHMSDIKSPVTMALTETRAKKKPFIVQPLGEEGKEPTTKGPSIGEWLADLRAELEAANTVDEVEAIIARPRVQAAKTKLVNGALKELNDMIDKARGETGDAPTDEDIFPGDTP